MREYSTITTACDKKEIAEKIQKTLLEKHLIACCQIFEMDSTYWWKGELETAHEYFLQMKTRKSLFEKVKAEILKIHDYETCEIASYDITQISTDFADWIYEETKQELI